MTLGRRKDAERKKTGKRKNGKREGFTGLGGCQHNRKAVTITILVKFL